jgi:hypothetical protein
VSIEDIEDTIVDLAARFPMERVHLDQWQAAYLAERLQGRRVHALIVPIEAARLDQLTTRLKGIFAKREIRIPASEHDLIEQLENVEVVESGARNRRRDRVRFDSGSGTGAGAHDDLVVALALCAEVLQASVGRRKLPVHGCEWEAYHKRERRCFIWWPQSGVLPSGDPLCMACPGWKAITARYQEHLANGGPNIGHRAFYQQHFDCHGAGAASFGFGHTDLG